MEKPSSFIFENENVYIAQDIYDYDTAFFNGVNTKMRTIITKKNLKDDDYCWGYIKGGKWIVSVSLYPKAKLLLKEEWVVLNVPKMMSVVKPDMYKYQEAPDILELTNEEKFRDKDGNIINIEVRGERQHNECYFKVKDVSDGFCMANLNTVLVNKDNTYEKNTDYKTFSVCQLINSESTFSKRNYLFMTYDGMVKLLYISRNNNAKVFREWATQKLFTIQMGTTEAKEELSSEMLGINVKTLRKVFSVNSSKTPVVYLFGIGSAKELLKDDKYSDDDILCKYGCTEDIDRRSSEHEKLYRREFGKEIELLCFSIVDNKYIFNAEANIKQYFISNKVDYKNTKELIIISKKTLNQTKDHYKMIQNSYIGCYSQMYENIIKLEKEIIGLNNIIKLKDMEICNMKCDIKGKLLLSLAENKIELKDKDIELRNKDIELRNKEIEVLEYKIKFMELSNSK